MKSAPRGGNGAPLTIRLLFNRSPDRLGTNSRKRQSRRINGVPYTEYGNINFVVVPFATSGVASRPPS